MRCLTPMTVPNPRKGAKERFIRVPCQKCEACLQNKASQWFTRLYWQQRYSENAVFVTLTYDDDHLPVRVTEDGVIVADVCRQDIRLFHARLRKNLGPVRSPELKYFLVAEYGPNPTGQSVFGYVNRPHYHGIYFNLRKEDYGILEYAWRAGNVEFGDVTEGRMRYISGYVTEKLFVPEDAERLFAYISNGIGLQYVDDFREFHQDQMDRFFVPINGHKSVLPRYYKERLYTEAQRAVFSRKMEDKADQAFENDLKRFGGDTQALFDRYHDIRADFVRKLRKKHKKKQNV